jgi:hypothetical protein
LAVFLPLAVTVSFPDVGPFTVICERFISDAIYVAPPTGLLVTRALTVSFDLRISAVAERFDVSVPPADPVVELKKSERECFFLRVVVGTTGKLGGLISLSSVEVGETTRSSSPSCRPGNLTVPHDAAGTDVDDGGGIDCAALDLEAIVPCINRLPVVGTGLNLLIVTSCCRSAPLTVPDKSDLLLLVPMFNLSLIRPFVVPLASAAPLRTVPFPEENIEDVATEADLGLSERLVVKSDRSVLPEKWFACG